MSHHEFNKELFDFLQSGCTPYHAVHTLQEMLRKAGYQKLLETDRWDIQENHGYFIVRDTGTLLAFKTASGSWQQSSWRMLAAHTDSPSLQIKPQPLKESHSYNQLGVEIYGGPILATWFDRDLGIAGRVSLLDDKGKIVVKRIDFARPVAMIPNAAIHLNREVNKNYTIERQKHLFPLLCQTQDENHSFHAILTEQIHNEYPELSFQEILGFDLFCYDTQPPQVTGLTQDFISSSRLDNLVSCFVGAKAMVQPALADNCLLLCSNHEEIGSSSVAGAEGNFLSTVLERLIPDSAQRGRSLSQSHCISMDNAHALHPNFSEKHDPQHLPLLNHGPVVKYNANQRYASTSASAALFKKLCLTAAVPLQEFVMKNDLPCGSTIGPIVATRFGIQTVDVGVPSLAMHSIRECTGVKDPYMLAQVIALFLTHLD